MRPPGFDFRPRRYSPRASHRHLATAAIIGFASPGKEALYPIRDQETTIALTPGKLYDALRTAGVPDDKAREAAEEVADDEKDLADARFDVRAEVDHGNHACRRPRAHLVRSFTS